MRKIYPIILSIFLLIFSFYYANKVVDIISYQDPIMKNINKEKNKYEVKSRNVTIKDNEIIPGRNGRKVNEKKSFKKMKEYGKYNSSLYVFDEIKPSKSIDDYYDKYTSYGSSDSKNVALVFTVGRFDSLDKTLNILKENNTTATFFIDGLFLDNNIDKIKNLNKNKYEIELLSYNGGYDKIYFESSLHTLNNITNTPPKYCFTTYDQKEVLELCGSLSLHTITPSINAVNDSFSVVKNKLTGNSIILLKNNQDNLTTIINYIKQKGYNLVRLDELLSEQLEK